MACCDVPEPIQRVADTGIAVELPTELEAFLEVGAGEVVVTLASAT